MNKSMFHFIAIGTAAAGTTCASSNFMNDGGKPKDKDTSTRFEKMRLFFKNDEYM